MSIHVSNDMSIDVADDMSIDVVHDMSIDVADDMSIDKTAPHRGCSPSNLPGYLPVFIEIDYRDTVMVISSVGSVKFAVKPVEVLQFFKK